jgi:hypothetical protein
MQILGFEESCSQVLADMFAQRHEELYGVVALSGTSYSRLDWRLDIQASFSSSSTTICRLVIFRYHKH